MPAAFRSESAFEASAFEASAFRNASAAHGLRPLGDALIGHGILLSEPRLLTLDLQTGRAVPLPHSISLISATTCAQRSTARAVSFIGPTRTCRLALAMSVHRVKMG
jgi:hypothetical protein